MRRACLTAIAVLASAAPAAAQCPTEPAFDPAVPTWQQLHGFELGSRQATYHEVLRYMDAVDEASPRVVRSRLGRKTWRGRELPYVIVSNPDHLAPPRLRRIASAMRGIRNAELSRSEISRVASSLPAIVNVAANVHGNEPSGTDASMRLLYELAARTDCANVRRLDRLVSFILPLQNPDGREAGTRENAYGFDMNRDWFARTQPETDAKVELLRRYPPLFFIDAHEQTGTAYFFPPNADPIHHEISAPALDAINNTYAPAMRAAAERDGFDYTNYTTYDLFFMGYGDTVPATAFGSAGMTFEKGGQSPYAEKTAEQFATQDATLTAAAEDKRRLVRDWGSQWPAAEAQGRSGALEPNVVVQPENEVMFQVPRTKVFGYFLRADSATGDAARLARRLRSFDVRVYRLRREARIRGAHRYGVRGFRTLRVPAGTFWIPLAQPQKHWIQAILGEDSYVPFPYFYDVSSWSNPLLMGLEGGFAARANRLPLRRWRGGSLGAIRGDGPARRFRSDSSAALALVFDLLRAGARVVRSPKTTVVQGLSRTRLRALARARDVELRPGTLDPPPRHSVDLHLPKVAVLDDVFTLSGSSAGFTRYVLEQRFGIDAHRVTSAEVESGRLLTGDFTALVVPNGLVPTGGLTPAGLAQIQVFVRRGGRYVGFGRAGLVTAGAAGLTLATEQPAPSGYQVPGASLRVLMEFQQDKPLGWGFTSGETFVFNVQDPIIGASGSSGNAVASYPADRRFFVSGYTEGAEALEGTPAAIAEEVGDGEAIVFAFDPNFRAYTDSTIRMFANAILHPVAGDGARGGFGLDVVPARLARSAVDTPEAVIRVPLASEPALRAAVRSAGVPAAAAIARDLRGVSLRVPGARLLDAHEPAWARRVLDELRRRGVRPNLIVL